MTRAQIGTDAEAAQRDVIAVTSKTQVRVGLAQLVSIVLIGIGGSTWATTVTRDIAAIRENMTALAADHWKGVDSNRYRYRAQAAVDLWIERVSMSMSNATGKPIDLPPLILPDPNEAR